MTIKRGYRQSNKRKRRKTDTEIFPLCVQNNEARGVCSVTITPYNRWIKQNCIEYRVIQQTNVNVMVHTLSVLIINCKHYKITDFVSIYFN